VSGVVSAAVPPLRVGRRPVVILKPPTPSPRPLAVAYLSEAWAEQALRLVEGDPRIRQALDGVELSLLTIILHPPKGRYGFIYTAFDEGGLVDYRVGHDFSSVTKDITEPTFVVSGEYGVFASIQRGEMSERKAILSRRLHLTGSMVKAVRHMRALETFTQVLQSIPCET
jgi:hypothetical protein